jgi:hypothetical protein
MFRPPFICTRISSACCFIISRPIVRSFSSRPSGPINACSEIGDGGNDLVSGSSKLCSTVKEEGGALPKVVVDGESKLEDGSFVADGTTSDSCFLAFRRAARELAGDFGEGGAKELCDFGDVGCEDEAEIVSNDLGDDGAGEAG